ncbi:hypothetical protein [Synechococcus phage Ssp-JY38]|nr:hypothetical protein [Synechococcus phage Yong-L2-223]
MLDEDDIAERLIDLPPQVREFLTELRPEEISLLRQGIRLASAISTVGRATKWIIIVLLGILAGIIMIGESVQKILAWIVK